MIAGASDGWNGSVQDAEGGLAGDNGAVVSEGLADVLAEVLDALRDDPSSSLDVLIRRHPRQESEIRQLAEVVRLVRENSDSPACEPMLDFDELHGSGALVLGDFRLLREVGRGGMGVVYEAEQISLGRRVALKVLSPGIRLSARSTERFRREASAAGALHHTRIVPVYATGVWDGVPYYAMQFIDGSSLAQRIHAHRLHQQPGEAHVSDVSNHDGALLDPRLVMRWGHGIADALAYAHRHGILHRDVKPSNIIIDRADHAWITDFGLARCDAGVTLTITGDIVGTVRYMSPEQARGGQNVDERTDLYSLGATLFEALCGRPPFKGDDREELLRRVFLEPAPPVRSLRPDVPADIASIVDRLLEKEPDRRYPSATVLAEDIRRALAGEPLLLRPPGRIELARRFVARHRVGVALATAGALILLAFSAGTTVLAMKLADERDRATQEAERAERVNAFLTGILQLAAPGKDRRDLSMREALDIAAARLHHEFVDHPDVEMALRKTLGYLFWKCGLLAKAREQFEGAVTSAERVFSGNSPQVVSVKTELSSLLVYMDDLHAAEAILDGLPIEDESVTIALARVRFEQGDPAEARRLAETLIARSTGPRATVCSCTARDALDLVARACGSLNDTQGAIVARRAALRSVEDADPRDDVLIDEAAFYLGATLAESEDPGDLAEARRLLERTRGRMIERGQGGHLLAALVEGILANVADAEGDLVAAEQLFRTSLSIKRAIYDAGHEEVAATLGNYGSFLARHGRYDEAIILLDESIVMLREVFGEEHPRTRRAVARLAEWNAAREAGASAP